MTSIITWYIIGILVSAIGIFSYEYFYLYDKEIEYISTMAVWLIISVILDIYMGWPSKGYDLNIKKKKIS